MGHFNKSDKKHLDLDSEMGLMIAEVELTLNLSISRQLTYHQIIRRSTK